MAKDGLLEEYYKYREDPDSVPSDAYGQSLVTRVIAKYGSIENVPKLISKKDKNEEDNRKRVSLENKLKFIETSDEMQLNPDRIFDNRQDKEKLIRKYGYPKLNAVYREGRGDFLSKYSDTKLGEFFKNIYHSVKKQLGK
jgi:hypothetical protein